MKLSDKVKNKIDNYFNNVSAQELYELAAKKYGFEENIDIDNQTFDVIVSSHYTSILDNSIDMDASNKLSIAA